MAPMLSRATPVPHLCPSRCTWPCKQPFHPSPIVNIAMGPLPIQNNYHHLPSSVPLYLRFCIQTVLYFKYGMVQQYLYYDKRNLWGLIRGFNELLLALTSLVMNGTSATGYKSFKPNCTRQKCQMIARLGNLNQHPVPHLGLEFSKSWCCKKNIPYWWSPSSL